MLLLLLLILCFCGILVVCFKLTISVCKCSKHLVGKVVIVTGGNAGIGFETAVDLAARGARVILACRSEARGEEARERVVRRSGNPDVLCHRLDLASFASVRSFAAHILATEPKVDILINNAGIISSDQTKTEDGLDPTIQTNYFGPFLLTKLLLPVLEASAPSRIINLTSTVYRFGSTDFLDPTNGSTNYWSYLFMRDFKKYCDSKLCIVLKTIHMATRLRKTGITVNCVHPGMVSSDIVDCSNLLLLNYLKEHFFNAIIATPWEGAQIPVYLAVSPELNEVSGGYFSSCRAHDVSKPVLDPILAEKLYKVTEKIVKL